MIITLTPCNHLTRLQYHYYNTKSGILPILSLFRWSKYFIVDYSTTFHVYAAEFLCALLCSAAIALACSVTGNIFSNICLSGIIIFLPRFILILVHSTVTNIYAAASSTHFIPLLDNSYNMLAGQFLSVFEPSFHSSNDLSDMLLSGVSNAYTLILSIIYIAIACLLFTIRKSETAGKPALSWKLQFAIRCAIGFTISVFGTFMYIQLVNEDYTYGTPPYMYTIIAFIIAAYVLAILCGFLLNAGINNMTSYRANTDNIDYIRLSAQKQLITYDLWPCLLCCKQDHFLLKVYTIV